MRWEEVKKVHQAPGGVFLREGKIVSLLATAGSWYQNEVTPERIRYGISPKAGQEILEAFRNAIVAASSFKVFYKAAPGHWEDMGVFRAISMENTVVPGRHYPIIYCTLVHVP